MHTAGVLNQESASALQQTTLRKLDIHTPESGLGPSVTVDTGSHQKGSDLSTRLAGENLRGAHDMPPEARQRKSRQTERTPALQVPACAATDGSGKRTGSPRDGDTTVSHASGQERVPGVRENRANRTTRQVPRFTRAGARLPRPGVGRCPHTGGPSEGQCLVGGG